MVKSLGEKGLSSVQLIISAGLFAGLIVSVVKLMATQKELGVSSKSEFELTFFMDKVHDVLSDPAVCSLNFKGQKASYNDKVEKLSFIENEETKELVKVNSKLPNSSISLDKIVLNDEEEEVDSKAGTTNLYMHFTVPKGKIQIEKIRKVKIYFSDKDRRITECMANASVKDMREGRLPFWQQQGKALAYAKGFVSLGGPPVESLSLEGGLKIGDLSGDHPGMGQNEGFVRPRCIDKRAGVMYYDNDKNSFFYCNDRKGSWMPVQLQKQLPFQEREVFNVTMVGRVKKSLGSGHKFCEVQSKNQFLGSCSVYLMPNKGVWVVEGTGKSKSDNSPSVCNITCVK